jgi:Tfp pilus assembly protein PilZ
VPGTAEELGFAPLPDFSADLLPGPAAPERREGERVQVKLRPTDLRRFRELCLREVSRGGVFVYADYPHPLGTPVEVLLFAPGARDPFRFEGDVVHVVRSDELRASGEFPGMGIRLSRIDDRDREAIEEIISRVPEEDGPKPPAGPQPSAPESVAASPRPETWSEPFVKAPPRATTFVTAEDLIPGPEAPPLGPPQEFLASPSGSPQPQWPEPAPGPEPDAAPPPSMSPPPSEPERAAGTGTVAVASAGKRATVVERRQDPRDPRRIQMILRFQTLEEFRQIYEKDISRGGVFVGTQELRPLRSSLDVVLMPPGYSSGITLRGEVVHVTPPSFAHPEIEPGMGIQFLDLTPEKKATIEARLSGAPERGSEALWPREAPEEPPRRRAPAVERVAPPRVPEVQEEAPRRRTPVIERGARPRAPQVSRPPEVDEDIPVVELEEAISGEAEEEPPVAPPRAAPSPPPPARQGPPSRRPEPSSRAPGRSGPEEDLDRMLDQAFADIPGEPVEFPRAEASEAPTAPPTRPKSRESATVPTVEGPATPALPVEGGRISSAQARDLLENLELSLRKSNYYDLLGVKPNASQEKIRQAVDARMRAFLPETYRGKPDRDTLSTLALGRSRLEAVREILLDPERRAGYECSLGIFLVTEDELTKAEREARVRVRKRFWDQYARDNPVKVRKAEEFFKTALDDLRANDQQGALRNVRLALTFDPLCDRYVELLRKLQPKG